MKKTLLNLGKPLSKVQQRSIQGGGPKSCVTDSDCGGGMACCYHEYFGREVCLWAQFC
ncbi:hypothetical protein ABW636_06850 [Aquimarina sp. 2201CG1-2-11]|uniref:hypothetical protein n=1 Tax=Aquimarina discodermiae TaxID=3231043 RepID=UPI003461FB5F